MPLGGAELPGVERDFRGVVRCVHGGDCRGRKRLSGCFSLTRLPLAATDDSREPERSSHANPSGARDGSSDLRPAAPGLTRRNLGLLSQSPSSSSGAPTSPTVSRSRGGDSCLPWGRPTRSVSQSRRPTKVQRLLLEGAS